MNLTQFDLLCRHACENLGLADTSALGLGSCVSIDGVVFEVNFVEGQNSFLLLADMGAIAPEDRAGVYESLLALQLTAWDEPRVRFGFHPIHETAMLCVGVAFGENTDGAWLASLLKSVALQVAQWRTTYLAGKVTSPQGALASQY